MAPTLTFEYASKLQSTIDYYEALFAVLEARLNAGNGFDLMEIKNREHLAAKLWELKTELGLLHEYLEQ